ncbi:MAG TPA: hypothetical protein VMU03_07150, partial [Gammaproteobacteria bacterium]|nr:hypothetical protein [Gammaproteobacteria bacterium]
MLMLVVLGGVLMAGCGQKSGVGFRLPDGDAARGREAFLALRCNACHHVAGLDLPNQGNGAADVALGGQT